MPRPPRIFYAEAIHHVTARGNNQMALFRDAHDFRVYRKLCAIAKKRFGLKIYRWTFMTNHIHLLLQQIGSMGVAEAMHFIQGRYARYFGRKYHWKGHVWENRYTNRIVADERYFRRCAQYIEENPVKAGITEKAEDYPWSSAAFYARGHRDPLTDKEPGFDTTDVPEQIAKGMELIIGRRAVGTRDKLQELSQKLGIKLISRSRRSVYHD